LWSAQFNAKAPGSERRVFQGADAIKDIDPMKTREVTIFSGQHFTVLQGIQRIDTKSTHGWQVRYQGTKFFKDGTQDGSGAAQALDSAVKELFRRIAKFPAPVGLRQTPSPSKTTALPAGISGPKLVHSGDGGQAAVLSVLVPRFGRLPTVRNIHIGTPNTYTEERFSAAVDKAVELRAAVQQVYQAAATRAKRKEAESMKKARQSLAEAVRA
jgi:hypothetical protein